MNKYLEDRPYLNTFIQSARSMTLRDYSLKLNDVKPLQLTSDKLLKALHQTTNKSFYEDEQAIFKKLTSSTKDVEIFIYKNRPCVNFRQRHS